MARATRVNQKIRPHSAGDQELTMPMRKTNHGKRYLYDDNHGDGQSEGSDVSVADVEGLSGFVMAPCEDELSEITDKIHNLTRSVGHRKYPRHHSNHSSYYHHHQHQYQFRTLNRYQEEGKEETTWHTDNDGSTRYPGDEAMSNPLTEAAVVAWQFSTNSTSGAHPCRYNDNDSELPTNRSETRSTVTASAIEEKRSVLQDRVPQRRTIMGDTDSMDVASWESGATSRGGNCGSFSIGISQPDNKPRSVLTRCLPSWGTLSNLIFLLGCALTLWLAVEQLLVAKRHPLNSSGGQRSRRLEDGPMIRRSASLQALEPMKFVNVDPNAALSGFAANLTLSQEPDPNAISSESLPWDSLTPEQQETALEMGFTKPVDTSNSSSRQDSPQGDPQSATEAEVEPEPGAESTRLPVLDLSNTDNRPNATTDNILPQTPTEDGDLPNGAPTGEGPMPSNTASPSSDVIVPTDEVISINATTGQSSHQETNFNIIVFQVNGGSRVTKTMVLAFAASLCFTMVGVIEWIQLDFLFQLALTVGGVLGLLSAMLQECNPLASQVLHLLSLHSFLASAVAILWLRCRQPLSFTPTNSFQTLHRGRIIHKTKEEALMLADFLFATGSAIEVVASYATFGLDGVVPPLDIFRAGVFSAAFWVASALVYLCCSCKQA